jgi:serine/threonine protein kinase
MESDARLRGRQLGDFTLRECIGSGGFAAVYRSDQLLLGREAVVKVLHHRLSGSEVVLQRFMREARLASRLDHPYAAHVYAFGVEAEDGLAWIAMEFVHGTSLEQWLLDRGPLPLDTLVSFIEHVAEVVQNAHDHGIVHRDLKPSNVMMVEYAGRVFPKLLDFGIAKLLDQATQLGAPGTPLDLDDSLDPSKPIDTGSGNQNLTQADTTLGSPPYMSPEQWRDPLSVGPRSDLYSLGVMAYEALTGRQPFTGATIPAIAEQHLFGEVPPVGDQFPAALDRVFQRVLAKEPEDRPASVLAFARELRAAAQPPRRKTDPPPVHVQTEVVSVHRSRRKVWPLAAGGAVLAASAVAAFVLTTGASDGRPPPEAPAEVRAADPAPPAAPPPTPAPAPEIPPAGTARTVAPPPTETVVVQIESNPRGADVFRLPSETRVGATPWRAELPSEAGTQLFVVKKPGYADRRVEIDLRTGGTRSVKLVRAARGAPQPTPPASAGSGSRRKGEPVDPFGARRTP